MYVFTVCCVLQQLSGSTPGAMHDYRHAIQLNPNYALAYYNAANIYFFNRQFKQAGFFGCELTIG